MPPMLDSGTTEYEQEWVEPIVDDDDDNDGDNNNGVKTKKRRVCFHGTVSFRAISAAGRCRPTREAHRKQSAWPSEMPRHLCASLTDETDWEVANDDDHNNDDDGARTTSRRLAGRLEIRAWRRQV